MDQPTSVYHEVSLKRTGGKQPYGSPTSETINLYFPATWRGTEAMVVMTARRYTYGEGGWSDWQTYAESARKRDENGNGIYGADLTATARSRLGDQLRPAVDAWLASAAFPASRVVAVGQAVRREFGDMRGGYSARRVREIINVNEGDMLADDVIRYRQALDAFEAYSFLLGES